jgi:carboxyl-terminal processing protease
VKRHFNFATVLALCLLVSVTTYLLTRRQAQQSMNVRLKNVEAIEQSTRKYMEARDAILNRYIGQITQEELESGAVAGMVEALSDPWSYYLTPEQYQERISSNTSYAGIGVTVIEQKDPAAFVITEVFPDSPAQVAGLIPGDWITSVNATPVEELGGHDGVIASLRGEENTQITVGFKRGDVLNSRKIIRQIVTRQMVISEIVESIGYIRIVEFSTRVDDDFEEAVRRLLAADVKGFIIDLRDNPGGSERVMCNMLDLLLPKGRLISLESKNLILEYRESNASSVNIPMVILVNENSYSAAEFFAACMKEYNWAEIVGQATTGKGFAQEDIALEDGSGLHLSVLRYFTPNNVSLVGVGLTPDYLVSLTEDELGVARTDHEKDRQFVKARDVLLSKIPREAPETEPEATQN